MLIKRGDVEIVGVLKTNEKESKVLDTIANEALSEAKERKDKVSTKDVSEN